MEEVLVGLATAGVRSDAIEQERGGQVRGGFVIGGRRGDLAEGRAHWCGGHPSATEGPAGGQGGGATGAKGGEGPLRGGGAMMTAMVMGLAIAGRGVVCDSQAQPKWDSQSTRAPDHSACLGLVPSKESMATPLRENAESRDGQRQKVQIRFEKSSMYLPTKATI